MSRLVLCESPDGWSLHAPGSTDEDIACGAAPYLLCGTGEPTAADYEAARRVLASRELREADRVLERMQAQMAERLGDRDD